MELISVKHRQMFSSLEGKPRYLYRGRVTSSDVAIENNLIMWNTLGICVIDTAYNFTICNNNFIDDSILIGNYKHATDSFSLESV